MTTKQNEYTVYDNDGEDCGELLESTWDDDCEKFGVDKNGCPRRGESRRQMSAHMGKIPEL